MTEEMAKILGVIAIAQTIHDNAEYRQLTDHEGRIIKTYYEVKPVFVERLCEVLAEFEK